MSVGCRLLKAGEALLSQLMHTYQEIIGPWLYVAGCTRPELAFAVARLAQYSAVLTEVHLASPKTVMR